jgi:hypothetical protein
MRLILPLLLCACASVPPYTRIALPVVPLHGRPEQTALPPNAFEEPIPETYPHPDLVEAIDKGDRAPEDGLLVGEAWFVRRRVIEARYKELLAHYKADRFVWDSHRRLYEEQIAKADEALASVHPAWWEQYVPAACFMGGVVFTSAVVYAVK